MSNIVYTTTTSTSTSSVPTMKLYNKDKEIMERLVKELGIDESDFKRVRKQVEKEIALEERRVPVTGPDIMYIDFKPPLTIVRFKDGTKTIVKDIDEGEFDPEKGAAMAIAKKYLGDRYGYKKVIDYYVDRYNEKHGAK